jgi:gliding motility-associated-like protein
MKTPFEDKVCKLLESYSEEPPKTCWESLSGQLDAIRSEALSESGVQPQAARSAFQEGRSLLRQTIGRTAFRIGLGAAAAGSIGVGGYLLLRQPAEIRPEAPIITAQPDTGTATVARPDEAAAAATAVPLEQTAGNTTFQEGVPYHLLTEQPENSAATTTGVTAQQAAETSTQPSQQPQQAAGNNHPEVPAGNTAPNNTLKQPAAEEENPPATEESHPEQPDLRIPNVISPNGDNINDYFVIENIGQTTHNQLTIYTRNGKVVYDRKDYNNSWNAENLPAGTYLYWFSFEYAGHEFMRQGSVKVIR